MMGVLSQDSLIAKDKHAVKVMVAVVGECEESHLSLPNNET